MADQDFIPAGRAILALPTEVDHDSLVELANRITNAVSHADDCVRNAVAYALEAGNLLCQAKQKVGHGDWLSWLTQHVQVAPRTAQAYMRLAKKLPLLPAGEAQRVADLPLREAIAAITTSPTAPPPNHRVYIAARTDRERVSCKLRDASNVLHKISKAVDFSGTRRKDIERARNVLEEALQALNELGVADAA